MYNFDENVDRLGTDCIKWDRLEQEFGRADAIPLWIADTDFPACPELVDAIVKRAAHPSYGYSFASDGYYDNFIAWNKTRNGYDVKREEIVGVPGIVCGCAFIIHALVEKGGKVLFCSPVYDPFYDVTNDQGCEVVTSSLLLENGRYVMDFADIEAKLKAGVGLFILSNPHNPVGRVWTPEELGKLSALCAEYKVPVFSDDIHSDLILPGNTYTPLPVVSEEARRNTVVAMAPSKTFNIAGIKSSYLVIADPELREKVARAISSFHVGVNLFGLAAAEAAYGVGGRWLDEQMEYVAENARMVESFCREKMPRIKTYVPEGTFLLWMDCTGLGLSREKLMKAMIGAGVALNDGALYGPGGEGFVRMNIGTSRALLEQALAQMAEVFG